MTSISLTKGLYSSRGGIAAINQACRRFNPLKTRSANLTKLDMPPRNLPVNIHGMPDWYNPMSLFFGVHGGKLL